MEHGDYKRVARICARVARRMQMRDEDGDGDLEDLIQIVAMKICRSQHPYSEDDAFISRVAATTIMDWYRSHKRHRDRCARVRDAIDGQHYSLESAVVARRQLRRRWLSVPEIAAQDLLVASGVVEGERLSTAARVRVHRARAHVRRVFPGE